MKFSTSEKVRIARERSGHTQEFMAVHIGMSLTQYKAREQGKGKSWRLSELESVAKTLGVELYELIGD